MQKGRGFSRVLHAVLRQPLSPPLALCCLLSGGSFLGGYAYRFFGRLRGSRSDSIYARFSRKNSAHGFERVSPSSPWFRTVPHHMGLVTGIDLSFVPDEDVVPGVYGAPDSFDPHR